MGTDLLALLQIVCTCSPTHKPFAWPPTEFDCSCAVAHQGSTSLSSDTPCLICYVCITWKIWAPQFVAHLFVFLFAVGLLQRVASSIFKLKKLKARDGAGALSVEHGPDLTPFLKQREDCWKWRVCNVLQACTLMRYKTNGPCCISGCLISNNIRRPNICKTFIVY